MLNPSEPREGAGNDRPPARFILPLAVTGLVLALALFGAALFLWVGGSAQAAIGGPFTLENGQGQTVTNRSFRGKYMLVYFGYTHCPDVCPTTLNEMTQAITMMGDKAKLIQPLFITIDPTRDTPAVVRHYVEAFSPTLVGLTGTPAEIDKVLREYHVYAAKHPTGPKPNDYTMDHSSFMYLMNPKGHFVAPLDAGDTAAQLAAKLDSMVS